MRGIILRLEHAVPYLGLVVLVQQHFSHLVPNSMSFGVTKLVQNIMITPQHISCKRTTHKLDFALITDMIIFGHSQTQFSVQFNVLISQITDRPSKFARDDYLRAVVERDSYRLVRTDLLPESRVYDSSDVLESNPFYPPSLISWTCATWKYCRFLTRRSCCHHLGLRLVRRLPLLFKTS